MGNKQTLSQAEVQQLCSETLFTPVEVKRIHKRFVGLDKLNRGYVTASDLNSVPGVDKNPLGERICKLFTQSTGTTAYDIDSEGRKNIVDFREFLRALSLFHQSAQSKEEEKLRFLFRVYDLDQDGLLSAEEVRLTVKKIVGESIEETHLHQIVDRTMADLLDDDANEGKIDFQQFCRIFQVQPANSAWQN